MSARGLLASDAFVAAHSLRISSPLCTRTSLQRNAAASGCARIVPVNDAR